MARDKFTAAVYGAIIGSIITAAGGVVAAKINGLATVNGAKIAAHATEVRPAPASAASSKTSVVVLPDDLSLTDAKASVSTQDHASEEDDRRNIQDLGYRFYRACVESVRAQDSGKLIPFTTAKFGTQDEIRVVIKMLNKDLHKKGMRILSYAQTDWEIEHIDSDSAVVWFYTSITFEKDGKIESTIQQKKRLIDKYHGEWLLGAYAPVTDEPES
jgi:hypothetical protein